MSTKEKQAKAAQRKARVRAKVSGAVHRPRVSVSSSLTGIFVQLIDDITGKTLVSGRDKALKGNKTERAAELGSIIAKEAKKAGIVSVVFDRGGRRYHGRVKAFADALRKQGINV